MSNHSIVQSMPNFGIEEQKACSNYMGNGGFITEYKETVRLESQLAAYIKTKHCIMTTSGTTALVLALLSLDIGKGDEVIVPNYTMIASVNAIKMTGAVPVIVDVDIESFTLSVGTISAAITENTKAIMHVSLNNRCKDLEKIVKFCNEKGLLLVEDSAQSLGCLYNKQHFGTFGVVGCFSLSTPKIISTGQGGFIVTDDDEIASKARMIKNFGRKQSGNDNFGCFGINLKFTDLQAVIGIEQLKKLDYRVKRMREMYEIYYDKLHDYFYMIKPSDDDWIPWFIDIYTDKRLELIVYLKENGIQTRPGYPQVNKTPMYYSEDVLPNSLYVSEKCLFLPSHTLLTNDDIYRVCDSLIKWFGS
jgi:perosamine synthetase